MSDDERVGRRPAGGVQARETDPPRGEHKSRSGDGEFAKMWLGESVSVVGDQISLFALPSLAILTLHASSEQVGYLNAITTAAFPMCAVFFGAVMERVRCRRFMVAADLIRTAIFALIAALSMAGVLTLADLFAAAAVAGVSAVLFDVGYQTHLPRLVSRGFLATGNARLEVSYSVARSCGPALGGALTQALGPALAVAVNAVSFVASAAGLLSIRPPETKPRRVAHEPPVSELLAGLRFLWHHQSLRMLSSAAVIRNFGVAMIDTLILLFLYRGLRWNPALAGVVLTLAMVGGIAGAAISRRFVARFGLSRTLIATTMEGVVWLVIPVALLTHPLVVVIAVALVSAVWLPIWNVAVLTFRQLETPPHLIGRVQAAARAVNLAAAPLGALVGGVVADHLARGLGDRLGLAIALVIGGVCASAGLPFLLHREVRRHVMSPAGEEPRPARQS